MQHALQLVLKLRKMWYGKQFLQIYNKIFTFCSDNRTRPSSGLRDRRNLKMRFQKIITFRKRERERVVSDLSYFFTLIAIDGQTEYEEVNHTGWSGCFSSCLAGTLAVAAGPNALHSHDWNADFIFLGSIFALYWFAYNSDERDLRRVIRKIWTG